MQLHGQLTKYYLYWDEFLRGWLDKTMVCPPHGDTFDTRRDLYMPEPWWGWAGSVDVTLHAVVINLTPGESSSDHDPQTVRDKLGTDWSYRASMAGTDAFSIRKQLPATDKWHLEKRARILTLFSTGGLKLADPVGHTLSIELCPWHSGSPDKVMKRFWDTAEPHAATARTYFENIIGFAAEASRLAEGRLKNTVIVRCKSSTFHTLLTPFGLTVSQPVCHTPTLKGIKSATFIHPDWPDVSFVCISGCRNNLPSLKNLVKIFM